MKGSTHQNRHHSYIQWSDVLFIPSAFVGSYLLTRWISLPFAITASVVLNLLIFALFEPRRDGLKKFILAIAAAAIVTFFLAMVLRWLY